MTPPLDAEAACAGCFLRERTGGRCPVARDVYGLESPGEAERRAEAIRAAIQEEAKSGLDLSALIQRDAELNCRVASQSALPAANQTLPTNSREEAAVHVDAARPIQ